VLIKQTRVIAATAHKTIRFMIASTRSDRIETVVFVSNAGGGIESGTTRLVRLSRGFFEVTSLDRDFFRPIQYNNDLFCAGAIIVSHH
jgi:hypothetical protein